MFSTGFYGCLSVPLPMRMSIKDSWIFIVIVVYCLMFSGICIPLVSGDTCLEDQRSLLLQLKNNLTYDDRLMANKLVQWNANVDCCNWNGVTCQDGRVIGLDLSMEFISGGIDNSSSLFSLQYLQNLSLAYNPMNSTIPTAFYKLENLISLNLSNAGFKGQIPIEISRLKRLVTLDISTRSYSIDYVLKLENPKLRMLLQNLTEMRELYLDGVSISSSGNEWSSALSFLPNLQVLSLSSCNISGPLSPSLTNLHNLSIIRLSQNNLSTPVPEFFANFWHLTVLDLSSCELSGTFPVNIFHLQKLWFLDISFNVNLHGHFPDFPKNGSLQKLILSITNFNGALPDSMSNLRQLSRLDLSTCNFSGKLPFPLSNLSELVYLDMSFNNFNGPIPSFSMTKKLEHIDLSHNYLAGEVTSGHLKDLAKLAYIDFQDNVLNGSIPLHLFGLPSLRQLYLSNNQFSGQVNEFENVSSSSVLNTLDLSGNNLEGPIPSSIFQLRRLSVIQLSFNNFSGSLMLQKIGSLKNLTTLDLSYNSLSVNASDHGSAFPNITNLKLASCGLTTIPAFLQHQSRLNNLDLSNNEIHGSIPNWLWNFNSLIYLNLSSNSLTHLEEPSENFSSNVNVLDLHLNQIQGSSLVFPQFASYVDYSSNKFNSVIPSDIGDYLSRTIFFSLSNNSFQGSIPESICNACSLQVLDLSYNALYGTVPQCLTMIESLGVLNLRSNNLSGYIPDSFSPSCSLRTLDLNGNGFGGRVPLYLPNCTELEVVDLGNNEIEDRFPCALKPISSLRVLVLRQNHFYGKIGCAMIHGDWQMLQILDIAANNFSGPIPGERLKTWKAMIPDEGEAESKQNHIRFEVLNYGQIYYQDAVTVTIKGLQMNLVKILTVFTSIDLSCNRLVGRIPEELLQLKALYVLNLSHNVLSGDIPSSIGSLRQLESLDLSVNYLSGEIPLQLSSLNFLSFLNLSFNQLVGKIPTGPQFQTFSADSFSGNAELCGSPLINNCSDPGNTPTSQSVQYTGKKFDWQIVSTAMGFGVGAGLVVAPLVFWDKARNWSDRILMVVLPIFEFVYTPTDDDIAETEDKDDEDDSDISDDCDVDGSTISGQYCVFCSKLDISFTKVIHDIKCTCHHSQPNSSCTSISSSSI